MPKHNILQFNLDDIAPDQWQLLTKAHSLSFGRRLYRLQTSDACYWLKLQYQSVHEIVEQNYLHELNFYATHTGLNCVLPTQYIDLTAQPEFSQTYSSLLLPHAPPWLGVANDLSLTQIATKILAMLESLDELAQQGLIHADLKQEHFVNWQGQLKLLDFEHIQPIAQIQPQLSATPRYMAPELFHAAPKTLQTELYALGIIVYEWLSGQRLKATTYQDWAILHCQRLNIQLPQRYQPFLSLLMGLTAKLKQARLSDIAAAKAEIAAIFSQKF